MVFGKILNLLWQKFVPTLAKFSYFVGQIIIVLNIDKNSSSSGTLVTTK